MRAPIHWVAAPLLFVVAVIAGCGSSTDNSVPPAEVVVLSGDAQLGTIGLALAQPLQARVTSAEGGVVPGATVAWVVTQGGGSVSSPTGQTDAMGRSHVTWTLGAALGLQSVEARVGTLPPAVFSATAGKPDPCTTPTRYALGTTTDGALAPFDCAFGDGSYIDYYGFHTNGLQSRRFTLTSDSFDTFLFITDGSANSLALDNDGTGASNSSLHILLGGGDYQVGVNSLNPVSTGPYTLTSATVPSEVTDCEDVWATDGVSVAETISTTDCLDPSGPYYTDGILVWLEVRQLITVAQHSAEFDALVGLFDLSTGTVVASDDDSGPERDALMTYTAEHTGEFVILATTFLAGKTGAYTVTIQAPLSDVRQSAPGAGYSAASLLQLIRSGELHHPRRLPGGVIQAALAAGALREGRTKE